MLDIIVPESSHNFDKGNFMVTTRVDRSKGSDDFISQPSYSRRPALVRHKSILLRYLDTVIKSAWLLTGLSTESQVVRVKLLENLYEDAVFILSLLLDAAISNPCC